MSFSLFSCLSRFYFSTFFWFRVAGIVELTSIEQEQLTIHIHILGKFSLFFINGNIYVIITPKKNAYRRGIFIRRIQLKFSKGIKQFPVQFETEYFLWSFKFLVGLKVASRKKLKFPQLNAYINFCTGYEFTQPLCHWLDMTQCQFLNGSTADLNCFPFHWPIALPRQMSSVRFSIYP